MGASQVLYGHSDCAQKEALSLGSQPSGEGLGRSSTTITLTVAHTRFCRGSRGSRGQDPLPGYFCDLEFPTVWVR